MRTFSPMEMLGADMKSRQQRQREREALEAQHGKKIVPAEFIKYGEWNKNLELWWASLHGYFWTWQNGEAINGTYKAIDIK